MEPNTTRDEEAALPVNAQPQRPRSAVPSLLFIGFMVYMLTSHNGDEFLARHQYQDVLQTLTYHLSNYSSWMNGTSSNFSMPEREPAIPNLLGAFSIHGRPLEPSIESYYSNITGYIHGDAAFTNITLPALQANGTIPWKHHAEQLMKNVNFTAIGARLGNWNWNTSTKVSLSVTEKVPVDFKRQPISSKPSVTLVHGRIELSNPSDSDNLRLEFEGVHFVSNGSIFGLAEPVGRLIDMRLLPSLVPDYARNETAQLIAPELHARIDKLQNLIDAGVVDSESSGSDEILKTSCPFEFYAQVDAVAIPEDLMQELEDELQNPTGIHTPPPPQLSLKGLLVSKACGVLYEISNTEGLRSRTFFRKVTTYAGLTGIGYLIMLFLFSRQAERSRTPSGMPRVSRWTFLVQTTMDSVSFAGHITFAILAEGRTSLSLVVPAFLACVMFTCQAQFSALVIRIQGPENYVPPPPTRPEAYDQRSSPPSEINTPPSSLPQNASPTNAVPNLIPAPQRPTTLVQPANNSPPTTFLAFFIHHIRTDPQAKMWLILIIFLMFIVRIIMSPVLSLLFVVMTYSSIWLPQIIRSIRRGRSSGLSAEYVLGTTTCRLFSAIYFLGCPKNVLEVEPRSWVWMLAAFVYFQAVLVILQNVFGPAFFVPRKFAEVKSYNYHPPMPFPEFPEQSLGDCAICMDAILLEPALGRPSLGLDSKESHAEKGSSSSFSIRRARGVTGVLNDVMRLGGVNTSSASKSYSLAPCCHLFHTECLEKWLAIKNICPQCRRPLPPL